MRLNTTGTTRFVVIIGRHAVKIARGVTGRRCNLYEAKTWATESQERKSILCPVVFCSWTGDALIMPSATPLTEAQKEAFIESDAFPDWDYIPGGSRSPFEYKASDWGFLDGKLVALDYSAPALFPHEED